MTKGEQLLVLKLRKDGLGYKAISKKTGIGQSTIAYFLKKTAGRPADECPQCGAKLEHTPHRKRKRFCSDKCRMLWWNEHQDQVNRKAYYTAVCECCGKEFTAYSCLHEASQG